MSGFVFYSISSGYIIKTFVLDLCTCIEICEQYLKCADQTAHPQILISVCTLFTAWIIEEEEEEEEEEQEVTVYLIM